VLANVSRAGSRYPLQQDEAHSTALRFAMKRTCLMLDGRQQLALIRSGSSLHYEACGAFGDVDGDIHVIMSYDFSSLRAVANTLCSVALERV
jgi:hypothetical protein